MKKKITAFLALSIVLLTTGCGGKKLTCTKKETNSEEKQTITFKKDKASTLNMVLSYDYSEANLSDDDVKQIKEQNYCDILKTEEGMDKAISKCKSSFNKNIYKVNATINLSKISKENSSVNTDTSYDDVKKYYEQQGYTCK